MDQLNCVLHHGQGFQPQKVELHQPRRFHPFHVELRRGHVRSRIAVQGHQLVQRTIANHHTGGVGRGIAQQPLNLLRIVKQPPGRVHPAIPFVLLGLAHFLADAFLLRHRLADRHRLHTLNRDHLRQPVHLPKRHLQHPAHVTYSGLRQQRAEGDDLPHPITPVLLLHVTDHLFPAIHTEVDVKVRHRHPFRVQEPFKQQAVAQRIKVSDRQGIRHQRARTRATPRPHRDQLIF